MPIEYYSDRRTGPRRPLRMLCQAVRERGFALLGDVALDLSPDGMLLRARGRALTGDAVLVSFFEPLGARWYDLEATVARVVHARRTTDVERCVGLQFTDLAPADRAGLRAALDARRAYAVPRLRPRR